jgi:hypothetical protein
MAAEKKACPVACGGLWLRGVLLLATAARPMTALKWYEYLVL